MLQPRPGAPIGQDEDTYFPRLRGPRRPTSSMVPYQRDAHQEGRSPEGAGLGGAEGPHKEAQNSGLCPAVLGRVLWDCLGLQLPYLVTFTRVHLVAS